MHVIRINALLVLLLLQLLVLLFLSQTKKYDHNHLQDVFLTLMGTLASHLQ
jgi:hypothetical protein